MNDAAAQLALMTKAKLVFETPGTFLSFPVLSPLSYSPEQLTFSTTGEFTVQDLAELSEFARITNVMPSGPVAPAASGEMLWEVVRDVLDRGEHADGAMNPAEQAQYDQAMAVLYEPSAGPVHGADSAALRAYHQYRDAAIVAQESYTAAKLTAVSSSDPAVAAQWAVDEPRLRAEVAASETAWAISGHRDQVEAAQQVVLTMGARSPQHLWTEWQTAFQPVIDTTTDTTRLDTADTLFAPTDVFTAESWPSFTLNASEIGSLLVQAPPELAAVLGAAASGADGSELESISFEFRSVGLLRSWFPKRIVQERFWRLSAAGGDLSDGGTPPTGRCPSYVSGLVFARNIVVTYKAQPPVRVDGAQWRDLVLTHGGGLVLRGEAGGVIVRDHRDPVQTPPIVPPIVRDHRPVDDPIDTEPPQRRPGSGTGFGGVRRAPQLMAAQLMAPQLSAVVRDHRGGGDIIIRDHRLGGLEGQVFTTVPPAALPVDTPPVVPLPAPPEPVGPPSTDITILAYICTKAPRWPDPDLGLHWPGDPEPATSHPSPRIHVVAAGDTLARLAKHFYGDSAKWPVIAKANKITDPSKLRVGQRLTIP